MLKVVSNTSPLISLLKIEKLDLLKKIYQKLIVPKAVCDELDKAKDIPYYINIRKLDWVKILEIKDKKALQYFIDLDAGEAEVIVLANEIQADLVIIDETLGRRFARNSNLKVTGTIGILIKAKELGYIDRVAPLLDLLQEKGVWISNRLKENILTIINEKL